MEKKMNVKKIILASSSPRRIEMLKKTNIEFQIMPPNVIENLPPLISMEQAVMFLALKKALAVEKDLLSSMADLEGEEKSMASAHYENSVIIAADTVVYKDFIIGKPSSIEEALEIFQSLRNTSHYVATGVAFICPNTAKRKTFCEITEVFFKEYTDAEIEAYLATDEPWDKAGGYAIQGAWGKHVTHIEGDYQNVIGFPLTRIQEELSTF